MTRIRVAIETQFAVGAATGLGAYARGLADALRRRDDVDVVELRDERRDLWRFDRRLLWDQFRLPALAAGARPDVVHYTGGTMPIRRRGASVLTLHDLGWRRGEVPGRFYARWYFGGLAGLLARGADGIVADTHAAARDIADGLTIDPARIEVVGVGVAAPFFAVRRRPRAAAFALAVGTVEARKDLCTAVRAVARIPSLELLCAGPFTPYVDEVRRAAREAGIADRIRLLGYVDDGALLRLYEEAAMLVFPSRYEGFGLPPLQALACGLPVAAARTETTLEVLGDCARYAPVGDDAALADAMRAILAEDRRTPEKAAPGRARAQRFSWDAVAQRMTAVYRSALSKRAGR